MANLDLGKEIGPLPLGAWIAVVAGGLGIALWSRNSGETGVEIVEDTGSPEGVGTGEVGGWIETEPDENVEPGITNNDEWGNRSIQWLISQGYDPTWSYSAITKALNGGRGENKLSIREYSLWSAALRKWGPPPYPVNVPPPGSFPPPNPPMPIKRHKFNPSRKDPDRCSVCGRKRGFWLHEKKGANQDDDNPPEIGRHKFDPKRSNPRICRKCGKKKGFWQHNRAPNSGGPDGPPRRMSSSAGQANRFAYATVTMNPLPGSSLQSLSQIHYGNPNEWERIFAANRKGVRRADGSSGLIENPNRLGVGWRLIIPR